MSGESLDGEVHLLDPVIEQSERKFVSHSAIILSNNKGE